MKNSTQIKGKLIAYDPHLNLILSKLELKK